jgi:neopullulanase
MCRAVLLAVVVARVVFGAGPVVSKVEPPDWPAGSRPITLRMLVSGSGLAGAVVHCSLATGGVKVSSSGTHLFFDLTVPAGTKPGSYPIEIRTASGAANAAFAVAAPLAATGRFQGFSPEDIIYLIMPDRFANGDPSNDDPAISRGMHNRAKSRYYHGGDLDGIIQHLPYLKDLGVTALWLTPVYDNANRLNERDTYDDGAITDYHGYGATDFYAVDEHLGTVDKFRELVDKAHAAGIKVIQDQVANHTGPYHAWAQDPPTPTWLNGSEAKHLANDWRVWTLMDPHATPATRRSTLEGWFVNILPDLNQNDPEVARYLTQNTLWWIGRTGIDGIREDTLPYAPRTFWRDWTAAIRQSYPRFRVVGEVFDGDPGLVSFFQGGKARFDGVDSGVDTLFDFPLQGAVVNVFGGKAPIRELSQVLAHDALYVDPTRLVTFAGLHDQARFMNGKGATADGLVRAFAFLMTARGIPMIYYGDEIGMPGGNDPDNRRDFPGGWREDPRNAFEKSGRTAAEEQMFTAIRRLAHLRNASAALRTGRMIDLLVTDDVYAFARVSPQDRAIVIFNNGASDATLHVPLAGAQVADGTTLEDAYGSAPAAHVSGGALEVRLPARTVAIYR